MKNGKVVLVENLWMLLSKNISDIKEKGIKHNSELLHQSRVVPLSLSRFFLFFFFYLFLYNK